MDYNQRNLELLQALKGGNASARTELIYKNEKLVMSIAKRFTFNGKYELDDLQQEGFIGLMKAIELFDTSYDVAFSTYAAYWIKQAITRYIYNTGSTIRIPVHLREKIYLFHKEAGRLAAKLEHEPSAYEISKHMGISIYEVERLKTISEDIISLNKTIGEEDDSITLLDTIRAEQKSPEEIAERAEICTIVRREVDNLDPDKGQVIKLLYGLNCKACSLNETGERLNHTVAYHIEIDNFYQDKIA